MDSIKLDLNDFEKMEPAAVKIIEYFSKRLTKLRIDNDKFDSDISTRGRIAEIKAFQKFLATKKVTKVTKHVRSM